MSVNRVACRRERNIDEYGPRNGRKSIGDELDSSASRRGNSGGLLRLPAGTELN